jgi:hypothetical protein
VRDFVLVAATLIAAGWAVENSRALWAGMALIGVTASVALAGWNEREVIGAAWRMGVRAVSRYAARILRVSP